MRTSPSCPQPPKPPAAVPPKRPARSTRDQTGRETVPADYDRNIGPASLYSPAVKSGTHVPAAAPSHITLIADPVR
jgi:hypothetical protein